MEEMLNSADMDSIVSDDGIAESSVSDSAQDNSDTDLLLNTTEESYDDSSSMGGEEVGNPITVPVSFNNKSHNLSIDEAVKYSRMGMEYESIESDISTLDFLAIQNGVSRTDMIKGFLDAWENGIKLELLEKIDDEDLINDILESRKEKAKSAYEKMRASENEKQEAQKQNDDVSLKTRLANEFLELKKEFPDIAEYKDLPISVKKAAGEGMDLTSAYLLYRHKESRRIAGSKKSEQQANMASTGTAATTEESVNSVESAFLRGLIGK